MKSKITTMMVVLVAIALVVAIGCGKKEEKAKALKTEPETQAVEKAKQLPKSTGKMNDDIFVEITAQHMYLSGKLDPNAEPATYAKQLAEIAEEMEKLYKKFGVTEDEYNDYVEKVTEDPTRSMKLLERVTKRAEELQKAGK
jgi:predicted RND superfamily exporter protein